MSDHNWSINLCSEYIYIHSSLSVYNVWFCCQGAPRWQKSASEEKAPFEVFTVLTFVKVDIINFTYQQRYIRFYKQSLKFIFQDTSILITYSTIILLMFSSNLIKQKSKYIGLFSYPITKAITILLTNYWILKLVFWSNGVYSYLNHSFFSNCHNCLHAIIDVTYVANTLNIFRNAIF